MATILAIAVLAGFIQDPPTDQRFGFHASLNLENGALNIGVNRTADHGRKLRTGKNPPPYRWSVIDRSGAIQLVPLTSGTKPKIVGLPLTFSKQASSPGLRGDSYDSTSATAKVDWSGCKAGFYQLISSATIQGEGRRWTMKSDHHVYYWRPGNQPKDTVKPGQKFLKPGEGRRWQTGPNGPTGAVFTLQKVVPDKNMKFMGVLTLREDATGETLSQKTPLGFMRLDLAPVWKDGAAKDLIRRFGGKTVYSMGSYLPIMEDVHSTSSWTSERSAPVVIRDVWRAARPQNLSSLPPGILGYQQIQISGWFPLYVVFEADSKKLFPYKRNLQHRQRFVALIADPWVFDRLFSKTTMAQDFKDWKPKVQGQKGPTWPEVGMTPKQVAWLRGWPSLVAPLDETLQATSWRFLSRDRPPMVFNFKNRRLLAGEGVSKVR
jgi:hypothetical protein